MTQAWIFVGICILLGLANVIDGQRNIMTQQKSPEKPLSFFMPIFLQSSYISLGIGLVGALNAYQYDASSSQFTWMLLATFISVGLQHSVFIALQRGIEHQAQISLIHRDSQQQNQQKEQLQEQIQ